MVFKLWPGPLREMPPLHWTPLLDRGSELRNEHDAAGKVVALVSCRAGHVCSLRLGASSHAMPSPGVVQPSIQCPVSGCGGHEPAGSVLEGWKT